MADVEERRGKASGDNETARAAAATREPCLSAGRTDGRGMDGWRAPIAKYSSRSECRYLWVGSLLAKIAGTLERLSISKAAVVPCWPLSFPPQVARLRQVLEAGGVISQLGSGRSLRGGSTADFVSAQGDNPESDEDFFDPK